MVLVSEIISQLEQEKQMERDGETKAHRAKKTDVANGECMRKKTVGNRVSDPRSLCCRRHVAHVHDKKRIDNNTCTACDMDDDRD